jgi:hypothetical protein
MYLGHEHFFLRMARLVRAELHAPVLMLGRLVGDRAPSKQVVKVMNSGATGKRCPQCVVCFLESDGSLTVIAMIFQRCFSWTRHGRLKSELYALASERPQPYSSISSISLEKWVITSKWTPKSLPHK